jgi:hypothetical protein
MQDFIVQQHLVLSCDVVASDHPDDLAPNCDLE